MMISQLITYNENSFVREALKMVCLPKSKPQEALTVLDLIYQGGGREREQELQFWYFF